MPAKKVTPEMVEKWKQHRADGLTFKAIAGRFGVSDTVVQIYTNPRHYRYIGKQPAVETDAETEWRKRLPALPKGPTNLNQAILGDPLNGRSALDRRKNA